MDDNIRVLLAPSQKSYIYEGAWVFAYNIVNLLSGSEVPYDTSPIRQLVCLFFMSLSSCILISLFYKKKEFNFFVAFSAMLLALTPTAIRLVSHKYDSAHYGFAILTSLIPLIFHKKDKKLYSFLSIIFVSISFMTYHAMSGIYPIVVIFIVILMIVDNSDNKDIFKFILISLFSYIFSLIIYLVVLMTSEFDKSILGNGINGFYFSFIIQSFKNIFLCFVKYELAFINILVTILVLLFIAFLIKNSKNNKFFSFISIFILLILCLIIQFGYSPFVMHEKFVFFDLSRGYIYGYSITLSIIMICCVSFNIKFNITRILSIVLAIYFGILCIFYSYSLFRFKYYNDAIVNNLAIDLSNIDSVKNNEKSIVYIKGMIDFLPEYKKALSYFPSLGGSQLFPLGFSENFPSYLALRYYFNNEQIFDIFPYPPPTYIKFSNTYYDCKFYRISTNDNNILIELKKGF